MNINVLDVTTTPDGSVSTITVTDGEEIRTVTPDMVFDALLGGRMESNTMRLATYGIDILFNSQIIHITISMNPATRKMLKLRLGIDTRTATEKKQIDAASKEARLAAEREEARKKQQQWFEENRRKADEARAKGLVNISPEEKAKRRPKAILRTTD